MDTRVKIKFLGGLAGSLTGSCYLLQTEKGKNKFYYLIDSGMIHCSPENLIKENLQLIQNLKPLKPDQLNGIILTHGHIDHIGLIPLLVKNGFKGKIFCTTQSAELLPIMLEDSAKIQLHTNNLNQEKNNRFKKSSTKKNGLLYSMSDVEKVYSLIKNNGFGYGFWVKLEKGMGLKFYPSGHVMGGAVCVVRVQKRSKQYDYFGFSGDLGRGDGIILPPPKNIKEPLRAYLSDATYGGKTHPSRQEEISKLLKLIKEGVREEKKIIIPSFVLERAQEILYLICYYIQRGEIPEILIYLDSPMAIKATEVFAKNWRYPGLFRGQDRLNYNPFCPQENSLLRLTTTPEESAKLANSNGPHIIISGSGMCDHGRVREHLRIGLENEKTIVVLVGYMTEKSLGYKLKNAYPAVHMNGKLIEVKAKIVCFESFSAHADSKYLIKYISKIPRDNLSKIFIVHSGQKEALSLKLEIIKNKLLSEEKIIIPKLKGEYTF